MDQTHNFKKNLPYAKSTKQSKKLKRKQKRRKKKLITNRERTKEQGEGTIRCHGLEH